MPKRTFQKHEIKYSRKYKFVKTDELNWDLQEKRPNTKDRTQASWKTLGHHGTLAQAVKDLALRLADQDDAESLMGYVNDLEQTCDNLTAAIRAALKKDCKCIK